MGSEKERRKYYSAIIFSLLNLILFRIWNGKDCLTRNYMFGSSVNLKVQAEPSEMHSINLSSPKHKCGCILSMKFRKKVPENPETHHCSGVATTLRNTKIILQWVLLGKGWSSLFLCENNNKQLRTKTKGRKWEEVGEGGMGGGRKGKNGPLKNKILTIVFQRKTEDTKPMGQELQYS